MASSSTSLSVADSSSTRRWKYDVFLSFRGEDTRKNFTDHLHAALRRRGIITFIDDELRRGEQISSALLQAIEESRFSIIIFSKRYASSSWCLDELKKIHECVKVGGHTAFPVFYNVDPSHVRKQAGSYRVAFTKHERDYRDNMEKVSKWREALTKVSGVSGWDLRNKLESQVIQEIVLKIWKELNDASSSNLEDLVGVESRISAILSLLFIGSDEVRIVGLWGMAGIGKTTIAEVVFQSIRTQFEGCCFLSNVREKSQEKFPSHIQKELLSQIFGVENLNTDIYHGGVNVMKKRLHSMKVLIVFDDVNDCQQLEALAGNRECLGPGSRVIITTRDKRVLTEREVDATYEVKGLSNYEARTLFYRHAFKDKSAREDFFQLCSRAINYAKGIPLALKILGCFLRNRSKEEWEGELAKLEKMPIKKIQDVLKISFDGLDDTQKGIFLDIACFFKGQGKDYVTKILESCDFFPGIEMHILEEKSLITISGNVVGMHDLIQQMGWEIARQEHSRFWVNEDVIEMLRDNRGTEAVEGIFLDLSALEEQLCFSVDVFSKMRRLRVLRFCNAEIWQRWDYAWWENNDWYKNQYPQCKFNLNGVFKFLSNNLRYLYWDGFPFKFLPANFHPKELVEFNMCFSQLKQLWEGKKSFEMLEVINLCHSQHLIETPDFSGAPNLSRIFLKGCTRLVKVHPSIGALKKLIFLNFEDCKNLESFMGSMHMECLKILTLSGCSKLKKFPEVQGAMDNLSELSLKGTAIKRLPSSSEYLNGLALLNLGECESLESLPSCIFKLKSLKTVILSNCLRLKELPQIPGTMVSLKELFLDGTGLRELPSSIEHLNGLALLKLRNCKKLASLPESIFKLKSLKTLILSNCLRLKKLPEIRENMESLNELFLDDTGVRELPSSIEHLNGLVLLKLKNCEDLVSLPESIFKLKFLKTLTISNCLKLEKLPEIQETMGSLKELFLDETGLRELPSSIEHLSGLVLLEVKNCEKLASLPESIFKLKSLETLTISNCLKLKKLPEILENMESLKELFLDEIGVRQLPSSIEHLNGLVLLELKNCKKVAGLPESICKLTSLRTLTLSGCSELKKLPDDMGSLQGLEKLATNGIGIQEVPTSITRLTNLRVLSLAGCKGRNLGLALCSSPTQGLPLSSLSVLYSLRELNLSNCNLLQGALPSDLGSLSSLECLDLSRNNFITLPGSLSRLTRLRKLKLEHCRSLQSLQGLPSSVIELSARDCTSLETFPNPLNSYALRDFGYLDFNFFNCGRIAEKELSEIMEAIILGIRLVASTQKVVVIRDDSYEVFKFRCDDEYHAVVPGSCIPEWFIHKNMGCSVTVELPPRWYEGRVLGFAVCAVFEADISIGKFGRPAYVSVNDSGSFSRGNRVSTHFSEADHLLFVYHSLVGYDFDPDVNHWKVSIGRRSSGDVKMIGVRLVFEEDRIGNQPSSLAPRVSVEEIYCMLMRSRTFCGGDYTCGLHFPAGWGMTVSFSSVRPSEYTDEFPSVERIGCLATLQKLLLDLKSLIHRLVQRHHAIQV